MRYGYVYGMSGCVAAAVVLYFYHCMFKMSALLVQLRHRYNVNQTVESVIHHLQVRAEFEFFVRNVYKTTTKHVLRFYRLRSHIN